MNILKKPRKYLNILLLGIKLNIEGLINYFSRRKTFVFQMHTLNQYFHVVDLIEVLRLKADCKVYVLLPYEEIQLDGYQKDLPVYPYECTLILLFYSVVYGLDQRMKYPYLKLAKSKRVCGFHGLPTKGNAFIGVSRKIDEVFIYGSLMKDSWKRDTEHDKKIREIKVREIGQCKTDKYFIAKLPENGDSTRKIVIAPSFESCSLLHTYFEDICSYDYDRLSKCEIVFKPHPASLKRRNNQDSFFREDFFDLTKLEKLQERISRFKQVKFILNSEIDLTSLLSTNSVLITDYSGIAFDALLLKVPVVYLFDQAKVNNYFSNKYHINYNITNEFIESGGASQGYRVKEYSTAIDVAYQRIGLNSFYSKDYCRVVNELLYHPGQAINNTTKALYETN